MREVVALASRSTQRVGSLRELRLGAAHLAAQQRLAHRRLHRLRLRQPYRLRERVALRLLPPSLVCTAVERLRRQHVLARRARRAAAAAAAIAQRTRGWGTGSTEGCRRCERSTAPAAAFPQATAHRPGSRADGTVARCAALRPLGAAGATSARRRPRGDWHRAGMYSGAVHRARVGRAAPHHGAAPRPPDRLVPLVLLPFDRVL